MTTSRPPSFTLTVEGGVTDLVVRVDGDLDHETCDELRSTVEQNLTVRHSAGGRLLDLHLVFAGLRGIDSMGLSALLMIRRGTDAARVRLHLDERPPHLERLLEITGTLDHLTAPCRVKDGEQHPGTG
ncbi:STAS domain-containing protein [Streptomyces sp. NPDC005385]|uniref:STAS domain-containing protein n=1 Tax=Streptomyces sp. NPDC005385 TaxID=3157039 RepID=UPI0033B38838